MTAEEAAMIMMSGGNANIQSLSVTENKTYRAADYGCDGFDPVYVSVPQTVVGYEFPEGTSIEEVYDVVGDDTVIDKTLDLYIKTTINSRSDGGTEVIVGVYSSDGTISAPFAGGGYGSSIKNVKVDSVYVNPDTGEYDVTISFDGYVGPELKHQTTHQTGSLGILKGFGSSDHTLAVTNK